MKKSILFSLTAASLLLLASCGGNKPEAPSSEDSSSESIVKKYTVHFDLNGGVLPSGTTIEDQLVEEGHWATKPLISPSKAHSTFLGWFTEDGFQWNFMSPVMGNLNLFAHYSVNEESKVTLTFNPNNGESSYTVDTFIGDTISTKIPSKEGFVFKGWYYGEGNRFTGYVSEEVAKAKTLTAQYVQQDFNYYFEVNEDDTVTITGIRDVNSVVVSFPNQINGRAVTRIGKTALQSRIYVESVTIPASVKEIEPQFCNGARRMASFEVEAGNTAYKAENGILYNADFTVLVRVPAKAFLSSSCVIRSSVKEIGAYAFYDQKDEGINNVTFPETLETIGEYAFYGWSKATNLAFPDSLKTIGSHAFCAFDTAEKLTIKWGNGLEEIGEAAFFGQYVHDILVLPEGLKKIGVHAFSCTNGGNAITSVVLPSSLETFEGGVFANCYGIAKVSMNGESPAYKVEDNMLLSKDGKKLVWVPSDHKGNIVIPEGVEEIGEYACGEIRYYDSLTFPSTLSKIAPYAFFYNATLTSIEIPSSVKEIGESAFDRCEKLASVQLNEGLQRIGRYAFAEISASSISFPSSLKTIGENAFFGCRFSSISFAEGLEEIQDGAFYFLTSSYEEDSYDSYTSSLTNLSFPNSLVSIGDRAFANHEALKSITFGNGLTHLGSEAFSGAKPTQLSVASGGNLVVKDLGLYSSDFSTLFYESPGKTGELSLPSGLKTIAPYALSKVEVTGITLPNTLETIGEGAFYGAFDRNSDVALTFPSSLKEIGEGAFYGAKTDSIDFSTATSLETIGASAFEMNDGIQDLHFASSLKEIGKDAFYACPTTSLHFSEGLLSIGESAFFGNKNLGGEVVLPASLTSLGYSVFGSWGNTTASGNEITSLCVAEGSSSFFSENNVVYNASKTDVYAVAGKANGTISLPSTVTTIHPFALADATLVSGFSLPEGLLHIGDYAFSGDVSVSLLTLPSTVLTMGERLFHSWGTNQTVKIPHSLDYCERHYQSYWRDSSRANFVYDGE
ncbi:MAG: leucine-rich repeat protein [Candidatus Enteromonas sp.]|nr:leucine-rich repeat protein [Candidatus Enteromonas sp.]